MVFELPALPYDYSALEPFISAQTLEFHHDKHHATYVTDLNNLTQGTPLADQSLEAIIQLTHNDPNQSGVFNNAAQVWNHTFFWLGMQPSGGGAPTGELLALINRSFGSVEQFKTEFKTTGAAQFGSGYVWLVLDHDQLKVVKTANAVNPLVSQQVPLLTADVWEHAYYLDYQNRRLDFLQAFLDHLVNWEFAAQQLAKTSLATAKI